MCAMWVVVWAGGKGLGGKKKKSKRGGACIMVAYLKTHARGMCQCTIKGGWACWGGGGVCGGGGELKKSEERRICTIRKEIWCNTELARSKVNLWHVGSLFKGPLTAKMARLWRGAGGRELLGGGEKSPKLQGGYINGHSLGHHEKKKKKKKKKLRKYTHEVGILALGTNWGIGSDTVAGACKALFGSGSGRH